ESAHHCHAVRVVAHQATCVREKPVVINCRQFVERSQRNDLLKIWKNKATENHRIRSALDHLDQCRFVFAIVATFDNHDFHTARTTGRKDCSGLLLVSAKVAGTRQESNLPRSRNHPQQQVESLAEQFTGKRGHTSKIAAWSVKTGYETVLHRIAGVPKHDRDGG